MDLKISNIFKNSDSLWIHGIFYFLWALLIALIFTYSITVAKIYIEDQKINEINKIMIDYSSFEQKTDERLALDYKKKIDDFSLILSDHKISSNVLDFIEKNTLPKIWFSNFDMSQSTNEINLSGEAQDLETLRRQIQVFEKDQNNIKKIKVFSSQVEPSGKINFVLNILLDPKIF